MPKKLVSDERRSSGEVLSVAECQVWPFQTMTLPACPHGGVADEALAARISALDRLLHKHVIALNFVRVGAAHDGEVGRPSH